MKKTLLYLSLILFSSQSFSQIIFENGYFINNSGEKIECLIKNVDWKNNPTEFEYKLSESGENSIESIKNIKEFGIYNISKYYRETVNIDRSSTNLNHLSQVKEPQFKEEQLFLKTLIEGEASLYLYENGNLKRYFYKVGDSEIIQLIYKLYETKENDLGKNEEFKRQLWNSLKCNDFIMSDFEFINYKQKSLSKTFIKYNQCINSNIEDYSKKQKRDLFNLSIRPRLNNSSLEVTGGVVFQDTDLKKTNLGIGIEFEYIFPFNKNKWGLIIEPTYNTFNTSKTDRNENLSGDLQISTIEYNSIEIPVGLRHYFFLNNKSQLFINLSYSWDISYNSSYEVRRDNGSEFIKFGVSTAGSPTFGLGYKFKNKYGVEIRYLTEREILKDFPSYNAHYSKISLILGYNIL